MTLHAPGDVPPAGADGAAASAAKIGPARRLITMMLLAAAALDLARCGIVLATARHAGPAAALLLAGAGAATLSLWTARGCHGGRRWSVWAALLIGVASAPQAATTGFRLPYTIPDSATAALGVLLAVAVLATAEAPGAKNDSPEGLTRCTSRPRIGLPQSDAPDREGTEMAGNGHGRTKGESPGRSQDSRRRPGARERIAAERAAQRRAQARRRLLVPAASVTAVLAIIAAFVAVKLTLSQPGASESVAPAAVVRQVSTVPSAVLAQVSGGQSAATLHTVRKPGRPLVVGGKPAIVFVSEESCPFCAAERWPLAVALSHFGTWTHLGTTRSSATDVYPSTATLSFRTARYQSAQLTLRTTELADSLGRPLQSPTSLDRQLIGTYDVPPYVTGADQSGAVPFLDIANRYVLAGSQYSPQVLAGLSAGQIASQLRNPSSPVAKAIDGSAKVIIAAIDQVLHEHPAH